jgi:NAD(P)H-dependent FMN reductase
MASILIIAASDGNNLKLAEMIKEKGEEMGNQMSILNLCAVDFPMYTNARAKATETLEGLSEVMAQMAAVDSWFVVAPEYNGTFPSVLNNAIAWLSREGDDFRDLFNSRKVGLGTHSGSGGVYVLVAMRQLFAFLGCNVLGRVLLSNFSKPANPDTIVAMLGELEK